MKNRHAIKIRLEVPSLKVEMIESIFHIFFSANTKDKNTHEYISLFNLGAKLRI